jgi:hypothetical protein
VTAAARMLRLVGEIRWGRARRRSWVGSRDGGPGTYFGDEVPARMMGSAVNTGPRPPVFFPLWDCLAPTSRLVMAALKSAEAAKIRERPGRSSRTPESFDKDSLAPGGAVRVLRPEEQCRPGAATPICRLAVCAHPRASDERHAQRGRRATDWRARTVARWHNVR